MVKFIGIFCLVTAGSISTFGSENVPSDYCLDLLSTSSHFLISGISTQKLRPLDLETINFLSKRRDSLLPLLIKLPSPQSFIETLPEFTKFVWYGLPDITYVTEAYATFYLKNGNRTKIIIEKSGLVTLIVEATGKSRDLEIYSRILEIFKQNQGEAILKTVMQNPKHSPGEKSLAFILSNIDSSKPANLKALSQIFDYFNPKKLCSN